MLPEKDDHIEARRFAFYEVNKKLMKYYEELANVDDVSPCFVHGGELCKLYDSRFSMYVGDEPHRQGGMHLNVTGIPCDDMTCFGRRRGSSGATALVHSGYWSERSHRKEDVVVTECTKGWDGNDGVKALQKTHTGFGAVLEPPDIGDFVERTRPTSNFLRDETVICCIAFYFEINNIKQVL